MERYKGVLCQIFEFQLSRPSAGGGARRRSIPRLNMEGPSVEMGGTNPCGRLQRYPDIDRSPSDYSPGPGASPTSPWAPAPGVPPDLWPTPVAGSSGGQQQMSVPQHQSRRRSSTMHQFDPPQQRAQQQQQQQQEEQAYVDQFDQFVYQSQHMASSGSPLFQHRMQQQQQQQQQQQPPEVNIEVPSDSDSSRRPSRVSYGGGVGGGPSSSAISSAYEEDDDDPLRSRIREDKGASGGGGGGLGSAGGAGSRRESLARPSGGQRRTSICATVASNHPSLLAARPVLDRRSSHTGVLFPRSAGPSRTHTPGQTSPSGRHGGGASGGGENAYLIGYIRGRKWDPANNFFIPLFYPGYNSNMLGVPRRRSRGASLPGSMSANIDQEDIYRLRNFSLAGRKVVNRGDSLKARSTHSINSTGSR